MSELVYLPSDNSQLGSYERRADWALGNEVKDESAPDLNAQGFEPGTQMSEVELNVLPLDQAHRALLMFNVCLNRLLFKHPMRNFPYDSCCANRDLPLSSLSSRNIKCRGRKLPAQ